MWNRKKKYKSGTFGLDAATEKHLAEEVRDKGDVKARNKLVESHLGLAKRMASAYAKQDASFDDLYQEGNLALMRAAETFDPERGVRFSTYAAFWIRSHMQRYLASVRSHQYAAPASVAYSGGKTRGAAGKQNLVRVASLDPTEPAAGKHVQGGLISDMESPEETVGKKEMQAQLKWALARARKELNDERMDVVVEKRLLSEEPATLDAVGKEINLSREGARLLELRIIHKVRSAFGELAA